MSTRDENSICSSSRSVHARAIAVAVAVAVCRVSIHGGVHPATCELTHRARTASPFFLVCPTALWFLLSRYLSTAVNTVPTVAALKYGYCAARHNWNPTCSAVSHDQTIAVRYSTLAFKCRAHGPLGQGYTVRRKSDLSQNTSPSIERTSCLILLL